MGDMREPHFETPEHTIADLDSMNFFRDRITAVPVKEHEVFMVFNNDCDALNFTEWWHAMGKELFIRALEAEVKFP